MVILAHYTLPVIFGHRGACGHKYENSFESFDAAIEMGADGLETDAWALADNEVALFHDKAYHPPGKDPINIGRLTREELKQLRLPNGQEIPTLREFLARYAEKKTKAGQPVLFSIDLQDLKVGSLMIPILKEFHVLDRTLLCANAMITLKKVRAAELKTHLVASNMLDMINPEALKEGSKAKEVQIYAFNIDAGSYKEGMVELLHQNGFKCFIWDLHTEERLRKYIAVRPEAIYSNYPDLAFKIRQELIGK